LYTREVSRGFTPDLVCKTEKEFKQFTLYAVNQAMRVPPEAPGVEVLGWSYRPVFSSATCVLLARYQGHDVVLLMDKEAGCDARIEPPRVPEKTTVHVFRKQVGSACVFEVSTRDQPEVLSLLEATTIKPGE